MMAPMTPPARSLHLALLAALALAALAGSSAAVQARGGDEPLRVFIRAGVKTHGPGQHDHPRFLEEWSRLLNERGARAAGALRFPSAAELARTDVLVMYAAEAGTIRGAEREAFEGYLERGGGLVVVHDGICGEEPDWYQTRAGGAWEHGRAKWLEGELGLYFSDLEHPITGGLPHFDLDDEIYYEMHVAPQAQALANSFHDVFTIAPQMWVVDEGPYRAFVTLQGHNHATFSHPAFRALLLRGIAWAGRREVDLFNTPEEVAGLRYPPGGPLAPERAHEALVLHEDFELSLVAAEPLVVNPISLDWDERGRLWVVQTPGYPYKEQFSGIPAHDEVTILHDEDGDGRMDASTTFAGGLDLATSAVFHRDGVIVTQAPDILWLRDTDGDDLADVREVLYTGFGYGDTHAVMSNLRWGLDGWIYATQGYSGGASRDIRSPYFERESGRASVSYGSIPNGIFRFRPDGSAIEVVSAYGSNTWGLDFAPDGELFFTMANGSHLRHLVASEQALGADRIDGVLSWRDIVDHRRVERLSVADRAPYVQIDFVGGFTAASGSTVYSAGAWPAEYEGNHFVCEPTVNLVHRDLLRQDGISFVASKPRREEFLASTDNWFRPVHTRTGPDGALYVLDFYNQAAVHNDTRGPRHGPTNAALRPDRDRHHGRIWRVQHRNARTDVDLESDFQSALRRDRRWLEAGDARARRIDRSTPARRVRTLWRALQAGLPPAPLCAELGRAMQAEDSGVRRNAARIAAELRDSPAGEWTLAALSALPADPDPRVRLAALEAFRTLDRAPAALLRDCWPRLADDVSRSVFLTLVAQRPLEFARAALELRAARGPVELEELLRRTFALMGRRTEGSAIEALDLLAQLPAGVARDSEGFAMDLPGYLVALERSLPSDFSLAPAGARAPAALARLFEVHGDEAPVARALLPFVARLGAGASALGDVLGALEARCLETVEDPEVDLQTRLDALASLLATPSARARAIQASARFLGPYFPIEVPRRVIDELGRYPDAEIGAVLVGAFSGTSNAMREALFTRLVARPEWAMKLVRAIEHGEVLAGDLGPSRKFRLRNHADASVAQIASVVLDELEGGFAPELDRWIEDNLAVLQSQGDPVYGMHLFKVNCAVCHTIEGLDEEGAHVGPELTGMGAHGREHLLPFILDPNLSVEAAYVEYVAETIDGELVTGVLTSDGPNSLTLSNTGGDVRVRRDELESLRSTGRSLMPTGFEQLGPEALRDILTFLCQGYEDFRVVRLVDFVNSSTLNGLYDRARDAKPMRFVKYGVVEVLGVPMELIDPPRQPAENNALVLKGGARDDWESKQLMPQRVEIPLGYALQRMHVLGGIAAWGHPFFGQGEPILRWTWKYVDGSSEEVVLHDGDQFADWISRHDVPGSRYVEGLVAEGSWGQVRKFSLDPGRTEVALESLILESFDNRMAPTFLALTAQLAGAPPLEAPPEAALTAPRVLIVGGGSSHDYARWFDRELRASLTGAAGIAAEEIEYTERSADIEPRLAALDVLVLANNQPLVGEGLRAAIFAHVARGGGLLLLHASTWHNWTDWPEYNRELVGGGARSHEAYGVFDVSLDAARHPILEGLPERFAIQDELYRLEPDAGGALLEVLATGTSRDGGASFPVVWTTQREEGRVLCITLGHDGAAHENPAFRKLVSNGLRWLTGS
jgi:putative membrane-bound dehydrogenase-like protein